MLRAETALLVLLATVTFPVATCSEGDELWTCGS